MLLAGCAQVGAWQVVEAPDTVELGQSFLLQVERSWPLTATAPAWSAADFAPLQVRSEHAERSARGESLVERRTLRAWALRPGTVAWADRSLEVLSVLPADDPELLELPQDLRSTAPGGRLSPWWLLLLPLLAWGGVHAARRHRRRRAVAAVAEAGLSAAWSRLRRLREEDGADLGEEVLPLLRRASAVVFGPEALSWSVVELYAAIPDAVDQESRGWCLAQLHHCERTSYRGAHLAGEERGEVLAAASAFLIFLERQEAAA